jgi:hypothetical protein
MSYAAGFAFGERQAFDARRNGQEVEAAAGQARSAWERGRRDALSARSSAWAARRPDPQPCNAVAREVWNIEGVDA